MNKNFKISFVFALLFFCFVLQGCSNKKGLSSNKEFSQNEKSTININIQEQNTPVQSNIKPREESELLTIDNSLESISINDKEKSQLTNEDIKNKVASIKEEQKKEEEEKAKKNEEEKKWLEESLNTQEKYKESKDTGQDNDTINKDEQNSQRNTFGYIDGEYEETSSVVKAGELKSNSSSSSSKKKKTSNSEVDRGGTSSSSEEENTKQKNNIQVWIDKIYDCLIKGDWVELANHYEEFDSIRDHLKEYQYKGYNAAPNEKAYKFETSNNKHLGIITYSDGSIFTFLSSNKETNYGFDKVQYGDIEIDIQYDFSDGYFYFLSGFYIDTVTYSDFSQNTFYSEDDVYCIWHPENDY